MPDMQTASFLFVFLLIICFVTSKDVCEITPVANGDVLKEELVPLKNSSGYEIGRQVIYLQVDMSSEHTQSSLYIRCRDPYRFQGDRMRVFVKVTCTSGRWMPFPVCLLPTCHKMSLNYRGLEIEGQKVFLHGESFMPTCQHGYNVTENADKRIICENGQWTGNLPPCKNASEVLCQAPEKPNFGSMQLSGNIATVGSTVTFVCDTIHKLVGSPVSTCNSLGEWTSPTPNCVEIECEMPEKPEFGSFEIPGNPRVGSIVVYKCDPGRRLVGPASSKCFKSGEWAFPAPLCVEPCVVPDVANGELGKYEVEYRRYRWRTIFKTVSSGTTLTENEEVILKCNNNYVPKNQPVSEINITCRGGQLSPEPECESTRCDKSSLDYPGLIRSEGFLLDGQSFVPTCRSGYDITENSDKNIYCRKGSWIGNLPPCTTAISCQRPEDPENGRAVYSSLVYDSELRYECKSDLQVSPKDPRYCGPDGQWTGTKPVCREIECEMPEKPEFGSAELTGKPKLGSIVVYKCNPGRRLVGSGSSKCLKNGEWTFPAPICVEPCVVPDVSNGELGKYEEEYKRYRWRTVFKKLYAGATLDEDEEMILKCNDNYVPKSQPLREITITCRGGQLSPEPECVPTTCLGHPFPIENGEPVIASRNHGHTIWYRCDKGFEKGPTTGDVQCVYGKWVGRTPTCVDTRCDKSSLNYPGLITSEGFLLSGQSFVPTCRSGYDVTENSDKKIYCRKGIWSGNLPPCTTAQCKTEELLGFSGFVLEGNHRILDNGDSLMPTCAEGFEFSSKQDSRLYCHEGAWKGNLPPCSPAHCSSNPPVLENGRITSLRAVGHGSSVEYECFPLYKMEGKGTVICDRGQWTGSPPTCKDSRCYLKKLKVKEGVDLTDDNPIESNRRVHIVCIKGYTLRYPEVYCENGELKTEKLLSPCQENECEVKEISNGKILKEKTVPITNFFGIETGKETVREEANIGSVETSGAVLYVECNGEYTFHGEEEEEVEKHVGITCRRGEWTPLPVCLQPGKPIENKPSTVDEEVTSVPLIKELSTSHKNIITISQKPYTENTTVDEDLDGGHVMLDNNSTENEEVVVTEASVNPPCSCKYIVQDSILLAHDGKKIIKYNDEILSGSTVEFYCNHTGINRLRGRSSLTCPENCDWHSSMFPSCVGPGDDDVVIAVFAFPTENMKVGLGGTFYVIPETRLEFACRAEKGYRRNVEWIKPKGRGFIQPAVDGRGVYTSYYIVPQAKPQYSGKFTCSIRGVSFHSVNVEIGDVECPEIESTKELGVSYAPNRKFGGRANFHCFFPRLRNGPSYITCEASGLWSGPPPSCSVPTCSIGSIYDILAEGIVPLVDGITEEDVPYEYELRLGCDGKGLVLTGGRTAICSGNGYWKIGNNLQCIQGCGSFQKKNGSDLLISPDKEIYSMGESITFSCPVGKDLTTDVQRILCFNRGWTPDIDVLPDCQ